MTKAHNSNFDYDQYEDVGYFGQKAQNVADDAERYAKGDINAAQMGLSVAGEVGSAVGDATYAPLKWSESIIKAAMPFKSIEQLIDIGVRHLQKGITDSAPVQQLYQIAKDYPEVARTVEDGLNALELLPAGRAVTGGIKRTANAGVQNLDTRLEGFYTGDPIGAVSRGFSPDELWKQLWSPQARANYERKGTGQGRINEATQPDISETELVGNIRASMYMRDQEKGGPSDTVISNLPINKTHVRGTVRGDDREGFTRLMTSDLPEGHHVPDHILGRFIDNDRNIMGGRHGKEKLVAAGFNVVPPKAGNATIHVNDKGAHMSDIAAEGLGGRTTSGKVAAALRSKQALGAAESLFGKDWSPEQWKDYYHTAAMFERDKWYGSEELRKNVPKGGVSEYLANKVVGDPGPGLKSLLPKTFRNKSQMAVIAAYYNALNTRAKGKRKLTATQEQLISAVEHKKAQHPNVVEYDSKNNTLHYQGSYLSSEQALGGVSYRLAHDLNKNNIYSSVKDGHDLMGADPAGGQQLWNFSPIQVSKPGNLKEQGVDTGYKTASVAAKEADALKRTEEITGMKKRKDEGMLAYQQRVLRDWNAPVQLKHKAQVAELGLLTGVALTDGEEEE